ncbi:hypothetical protein ACIBI4_23585 [Streptomyces sp. NPDC050418]|uniref:hypothetical protein n=1 Tax=Streptomyces sp. NPDC050418 TaxID=3365612 RepID=UPI0037B3B9AB
MTTQTLLDWFTFLVLFALVAGPALAGQARERRIDRQLRQAERRELAADASGATDAAGAAGATDAAGATPSARVSYSRAA